MNKYRLILSIILLITMLGACSKERPADSGDTDNDKQQTVENSTSNDEANSSNNDEANSSSNDEDAQTDGVVEAVDTDLTIGEQTVDQTFTEEELLPLEELPYFADAYKDYFPIGVAISPRILSGNEDMIANEFSSITCENDMKFSRIHPKPDEYTFDNADTLVNFAMENNMLVRGHTLVWHDQTPSWLFEDENGELVDKETLYERMKEHIQTVVSRYKGKVYCWDVVNEGAGDVAGLELRHSQYYEVSGGDEYIEKAFIYAHEADPDALLFYNDYGMENIDKQDNVYFLIKRLLKRGVPIHGIGIQGHYSSAINYYGLQTTIDRFTALGLIVHITELDLSIYSGSEKTLNFDAPPEDRVEKQAKAYKEFFAFLRKNKDKIGSVSFWGLNDAVSWLNHYPVTRRDFPMLFDDDNNRKEAFRDVVVFIE